MRKLSLLLVIAFILPYFGIAQAVDDIDEIAPFSEGFAAIRKGNQWGFINEKGILIIDFRDDLVWNKNTNSTESGAANIRYPLFSDGKCMVKKLMDKIPIYGFIDTKGDLAIKHQFLNVSPFKNGYTTGVVFEKTLRGTNEFNLRIYDYKFNDVFNECRWKNRKVF